MVPIEEVIVNIVDNTIFIPGTELYKGIYKVEIQGLQGKDDFCKYILKMLNKNHLQTGQPYFIRGNILMQYVKGNKQAFETMVLPQSLTNHVHN